MILQYNVLNVKIGEDLIILMITVKMENFLNKVEETVAIVVVVIVIIQKIVVMEK